MTEPIKLTANDFVLGTWTENNWIIPFGNFSKEEYEIIPKQILENQKIVDGVLSLIAEERKKANENVPKEMEGICVMHWMDIVEARIRQVTGKDIKDLS